MGALTTNAHLCRWLLVLGAARADAPAMPIPAEKLACVTQVSNLPNAPLITVPEIATPEEPPSPPSRAPVPALPLSAAVPPSIVVLPNADGVLDESRVAATEALDGIPNPFRVRFHPPVPMKDVRLTIDSVLIGSRSEQKTAVINGRLYSPGEIVAGLCVAAISAEAVDLRHNGLLLRVPIQDKPVTLRLQRRKQ